MIVDANVLASAFLGRSSPLLLEIRERGVDLLMPHHQFVESRLVVQRKAGLSFAEFDRAAARFIDVLAIADYAALEGAARARLGPRGQPDWPVLASAIEYDDAIWSNDRDFFGVGVPVWTTANIKFAEA